MRSALIIFILTAISILTDLIVAESIEHNSSIDPAKFYATMFLFETLAVAAGEHFVRGDRFRFDVPSREDQKVAVIFGNLFLRLSSTKKLERILGDTCHMTETYYWEATSDEQKADTFHVHYTALKSAILGDPQLKCMYDEESERVDQQNLPSLTSARLSMLMFLLSPIRLNELIMETIRTNEKFRKLTIHLRFVQFSTGVVKDRRFEWPYGYGRGLTALGILRLSQSPEVGELTQRTYDRALEDISSKLGNETRKDRIDGMMFTTILLTFKRDEYLFTQLRALELQLSRIMLLH